jgi:hypothetical protein
MKPQRLQLMRRKGFDLQATSRAINGLECVKVDRSTALGNPFVVNPTMKPGAKLADGRIYVPTPEDAVECFREMLALEGETAAAFRACVAEAAGKNVACWCPVGSPCHGDVILAFANPELTP